MAPRLAALVASRQTRPIDPALTARSLASPPPMSCKRWCGATSGRRKRLLIGPVRPAAVRPGLSWPFHGSPLGGARGRRPIMRRPPHLAGRGGHWWAIRGEIMRSFSPPSSPPQHRPPARSRRLSPNFISFILDDIFISHAPPAEGAVAAPRRPPRFSGAGGHLASTPATALNTPALRGSIDQQGAAQRRL